MRQFTRNSLIPLFAITATAIITVGGPLAADLGAQTNELPRRTETVHWNSGKHNGTDQVDGQGAIRTAASEVVRVPGSPWMQLTFERASLGRMSYLEIRSIADGAVQHLDAEAMKQWGNRSAYFNGDAVEIKLFVGPRDRDVSVEIERVVVGEYAFGTKSICGPADDRVASNEPRVARIDPIGCTGYTTIIGQLLGAGHCLAGGSSNQTLSFNPPPSLPGGTVQFPGPQDQYAIQQGSFQFVNGGIGNDWGIFAVANNTQTGLQPNQAQGGFNLRRNLGPANIRITGFGVDQGVTNQTNQTHLGPNAGSTGTTMRYVTDTTGGNSGSPVIDEATGRVVGIHTHGGCFSSGGNNKGTSFFNTALWTAVYSCIDDCAYDYGECQVDFCYWDYDPYMCDVGCELEFDECRCDDCGDQSAC